TSTGNIIIDSGSSLITLSDNTTISQNLTIGGTTGLTFSTTGNISLAGGTISDSVGNLVLNDTTDIGGANGIRVTTAGSISDIDTSTLQLNDDVDITGSLFSSAGNLILNDTLVDIGSTTTGIRIDAA